MRICKVCSSERETEDSKATIFYDICATHVLRNEIDKQIERFVREFAPNGFIEDDEELVVPKMRKFLFNSFRIVVFAALKEALE